MGILKTDLMIAVVFVLFITGVLTIEITEKN